MKDARTRSLALLRAALNRTRMPKPRPRRPGAAGEAVAVDPPHSPTLSGGAAAPLDA